MAIDAPHDVQLDRGDFGVSALAARCADRQVGENPRRARRQQEQAVAKANANPGSTIVVPPGTYRLSIAPTGLDDNSTGDLNVTAATTILGWTQQIRSSIHRGSSGAL